jgi:hypothetical protein
MIQKKHTISLMMQDEAYLVDTMISETMVNTADSNRLSGKPGNHSQGPDGFPTLIGVR